MFQTFLRVKQSPIYKKFKTQNLAQLEKKLFGNDQNDGKCNYQTYRLLS